jgi:hypothetical protein
VHVPTKRSPSLDRRLAVASESDAAIALLVERHGRGVLLGNWPRDVMAQHLQRKLSRTRDTILEKFLRSFIRWQDYRDVSGPNSSVVHGGLVRDCGRACDCRRFLLAVVSNWASVMTLLLQPLNEGRSAAQATKANRHGHGALGPLPMRIERA